MPWFQKYTEKAHYMCAFLRLCGRHTRGPSYSFSSDRIARSKLEIRNTSLQSLTPRLSPSQRHHPINQINKNDTSLRLGPAHPRQPFRLRRCGMPKYNYVLVFHSTPCKMDWPKLMTVLHDAHIITGRSRTRPNQS